MRTEKCKAVDPVFFFFFYFMPRPIHQSKLGPSKQLNDTPTGLRKFDNSPHCHTALFFFPDKKYIRLKLIRKLKPRGEPTVTHVPSDRRSLFFHSSSSSARAQRVNDSFGQKKKEKKPPAQTQIGKYAGATGLLNEIAKNPWCFESKTSAEYRTEYSV